MNALHLDAGGWVALDNSHDASCGIRSLKAKSADLLAAGESAGEMETSGARPNGE